MVSIHKKPSSTVLSAGSMQILTATKILYHKKSTTLLWCFL